MPLTTGDVVPDPLKVSIKLSFTLTVAPARTSIPVIVALAPVEESLVIVLLLIFRMVATSVLPLIPLTFPPIPVEIRLKILLEENVQFPCEFVVGKYMPIYPR